MEEIIKKITKQLSKLGKAMLIPLAATPIAGLLARLAADDLLNLPVVENASWVVFGMMDVLFAIGAVMAYAKADDKAIPIIGSLISLEVFKAVLMYEDKTIDMGIFAGILVGVMTAVVYNRSKEWKLPDVLIFFRGEKLVVTLAPLISIGLAVICSYIWIPCQHGIDLFGRWIAGAGAFGVLIYGILNRLLIPTGLHHVINSYIYYQLGTYTTASGKVVTGEIPRFLAGDPTAGLFLAMFFIPMMFGLPGACMAIYKTAKKNIEKTKNFMISSALTSFVSGITEPIEFSFMFVAPKLYFLHALLTGAAGSILYLFNVHLGMSVNFCVIDFMMNYNMGTNSWIIIPIGIAFFFVYYNLFKYMIEKKDLQTPGREGDDVIKSDNIEQELDFVLNHSNYYYMAKKILENIGGKENVIDVESCVTRLRLELKDDSLVNEENIKRTGAGGIMRFGENEIQVIIGVEVNRITKEFKRLLDE